MRLLCFLAVGARSVVGKFETWSLVLLENAAKERGAVCLDGTASGYYIEPGFGSGIDKWMIHFQGGGWCTSLSDCVGRSKGSLGSSNSYSRDKEYILDHYDGGAHGVFSNDPSINPDFHNWNKVYVRYCDGASRAGDVADPVTIGKSLTPRRICRKLPTFFRKRLCSEDTIYFRGGRILDATLDNLLATGLDSASDLIVGGCSAGGLSVWLHLDHIRSKVPESVRVTGVPQCGLFMDLPKYDGTASYTALFQEVFKMQHVNESGTLSSECLSTYPDEQWRCFMAEYAMPFLKTPYFAVNSFFDAWQWENILRIDDDCDEDNLTSCSSQERDSIHGLRDSMHRVLSATPATSGFFAYSCTTHCGYFNHDEKWGSLLSNGVSLRTAFGSWYFGKTPVRTFAIAEEPNGNPSCSGRKMFGDYDSSGVQVFFENPADLLV